VRESNQLAYGKCLQHPKRGLSAKYVDPDRQGSRFGTGGGTTLRQGNTTFQFGPQRSFDQRYNNDRMFDPLGRPGESDNR
jgi:hypothetical protein